MDHLKPVWRTIVNDKDVERMAQTEYIAYDAFDVFLLVVGRDDDQTTMAGGGLILFHERRCGWHNHYCNRAQRY